MRWCHAGSWSLNFLRPVPKLNYQADANFFPVLSEEHFIEPAGIAVNSQGQSCVFHQGKQISFRGHIPSQYADDLFGTAHMLRIDPEDDIWTLPSELNFLAF